MPGGCLVSKQRARECVYVVSFVVLFMLIAGALRAYIRSIPGYRVLLAFLVAGAALGVLIVKKTPAAHRIFSQASAHLPGDGIRRILCAVLAVLLSSCIMQCFYVDNVKSLLYGDHPPKLFQMALERLSLNTAQSRTLLTLALAAAAVLSAYALTATLFALSCGIETCRRAGLPRYAYRFAQALLPCALLAGLLCFFGPCEMFFQNLADVDFTAADFVPQILLLWAFATAVLASLTAVLRGKAFTVAASVVFALGVCAYLQALVLNLRIGNVNQTVIDWTQYRSYSIGNSVIWVVLIAGMLLLLRFFPKVWRRCVPFVCVLIFGMQAASVIALSARTDAAVWSRNGSTGSYLTGNGQYTLGKDGNVVLLCLDAFDNQYLNEILDADPERLAFLHDFDYYNNYDCSNHSTQPSICCFLTGAKYDASKTWDDWYDDAWHSETATTFYTALSDAGYQTELYGNPTEIGDAKNMAGIADNVITCSSSHLFCDTQRALGGLILLSVYRACPFVMKRPVLAQIPDLNTTVHIGAAEGSDAAPMPDFNNYAFYDKLDDPGLQLADGKRFVFQYLHGVHEPIDTDPDCRKKTGATREEAVAGCLTLVERYLEALRTLGVYDNTTVIITADHGHWTCLQPIFLIKKAGQTHEKLAITRAPASHNELQATVLACLGADHATLGPSAFDFYDGQLRTRDCWSLTTSSQYPEAPKRGTVLTSIWNTYSRFTYTGDGDDLQKKITHGSSTPGDEVLVLTEAPW